MLVGYLCQQFAHRIARRWSFLPAECLPLTYNLICFNPLNANPKKWSNTLKQFVDNLPNNPVKSLSVFGHFVRLALKG